MGLDAAVFNVLLCHTISLQGRQISIVNLSKTRLMDLLLGEEMGNDSIAPSSKKVPGMVAFEVGNLNDSKERRLEVSTTGAFLMC